MSFDEYGQQYLTESELIKMIHTNPLMDLSKVLLDHPDQFNQANKELYAGFGQIKQYVKPEGSVDEFDKDNQTSWAMPDKYKDMDIQKWITDQCEYAEQLQRVQEELLLFRQRGLLPLLKFLKYTIDTFREKNIVWGVGRGSSVSSYVLFLLGVHKVDSIKYKLDIAEFLR